MMTTRSNGLLPVIAPVSNSTVAAASSATLQLSASITSGDTLHFTGASLPSFATLTDAGNDTATLTFHPAYSDTGTYTISFSASTTSGATTSSTFALVVSDPAGVFFVSGTGADSNTGTYHHPFRSIQKAATIASAGNTVLIRSGTYRESVIPAHSGITGAPITFMPYPGEKPVVSGTDTVSSVWTLASGTTYRTTWSAGSLGTGKDQVFVDGKMIQEARWPNTGSDVSRPVFSKLTGISGSLSGTTTMTVYDSALTQAAGYWNGATIHIIAGDMWNAQTGTVTSSASGSLTVDFGYTDSDGWYTPRTGNPYFLTGKKSALDAPGEWFLDAATSTLSVWTPTGMSPAANGTGPLVEVKRRRNAFDLSGRAFITIKKLGIFASTIISDAGTHDVLIDGITASYIGHEMLIPSATTSTGIILDGTGNEIRNSDIAFSSGNGILLRGSGQRITNCVIHDVDYAAVYDSAIAMRGNGHQVTHNTAYNAGRSLIDTGATGFTLSYNDLFNAGLQAADLGATYTYDQDGGGAVISYNQVHDIRPTKGTSKNAAIYLDNGTRNFVVHHNLVWNVEYALSVNVPTLYTGYQGPQNSKVYNNTLVGSSGCISSAPSPGSSISVPGGDGTGSEITNNLCSISDLYFPHAGATLQSNLLYTTDPKFTDPANLTFTLLNGSPAIDTGSLISPYTDGYIGSAPDLGALESGAAVWSAGANRVLPSAPINLGATPASGTSVQLSWSSQTGASGFVIERSKTLLNGALFEDIATVSGSSTGYLDSGLLQNTLYFYRLRSIDAATGYLSPPTSKVSTRTTGSTLANQTFNASNYDDMLGVMNHIANIGYLDPNDWVLFKNLNFSTGMASFTVSVATPNANGAKIEVHLDSPTGPLAGTLSVATTGSYGTFQSQSTSVSGASGVHDLYLVIKGSSGTGLLQAFSFSP